MHGTRSFATVEVAWVMAEPEMVLRSVDAIKSMNKEGSEGNKLAIIFSWDWELATQKERSSKEELKQN